MSHQHRGRHHHNKKLFEAYDSEDESRDPKRNQICYTIITGNSGGDPNSLKRATRIRRLKANTTLYKNIADYAKNSSDNFTVTITNVYKINRKGDPTNFSKKYRMMLWHGTNASNIPSILQSGFVLGSGGWFGAGVYFADRLAMSLPFTRASPGSGVPCYILLAEVNMGKVYKAHHIHTTYNAAPPGFRTVKGMGQVIPDWNGNRDYYGAIMPCGATKTNTRHPSFDLPYNEYIIYDTSRVIIRFLVECTW